MTTIMTYAAAESDTPIALHPDNPHYFAYQGEPLVLVTSAEHYGAVLNLDFDFERYLRTMHEEGMNYTRIFMGSYVERPESFSITNNTLSPAVGRFIAPWQRVDEPGLFMGESKFDLSKWNPDYFERLKAFVALAEELDIIVEVTLFCATYTDAGWERHPFNPGNNINGIDPALKREASNTKDNGGVFPYQIAMTKKVVEELNEYRNVFFEIQNEPWSDDGRRVRSIMQTLDSAPDKREWNKWSLIASERILEWQRAIVRAIVETEADLPQKHLIAQNYTNFWTSLHEVDDSVDVLNFHYAWPEAVWANYAWNRPIGFDESGFHGSEDETYLRQAWKFILAGGAMFNNLDYSFQVGVEDGRGKIDAPGGGSPELRRQLLILREFLETFDFIQMKPDREFVQHAPGLEWYGLSEAGQQYAACFYGVYPTGWMKLTLPKGKYAYEWVDPSTGKALQSGKVRSKGGSETVKLEYPVSVNRFALRLTAAK